MILSAKNLVFFILMALLVTVFSFHWFFVDKTMPAFECLSPNCVYSSPQIIPQEAKILLIVLAVLFSLLAVLIVSSPVLDIFTAVLGRFCVFRERPDTFCHKFYSWLKILEKRDPQTALTAARISDFRQ